jgi:hypothetical protein
MSRSGRLSSVIKNIFNKCDNDNELHKPFEWHDMGKKVSFVSKQHLYLNNTEKETGMKCTWKQKN